MKKIIVYKITDEDDLADTKYFTLKGLRNYILTDMWDRWNDIDESANDYSKKEIQKSDEYLFAYLETWNIQVERIAVLNETNF
jgi:hypothetical protein